MTPAVTHNIIMLLMWKVKVCFPYQILIRRFFSTKKYLCFSNFWMKTCCGYSLEASLMSTHSICFPQEIRKLFTWYPLLSRPMNDAFFYALPHTLSFCYAQHMLLIQKVRVCFAYQILIRRFFNQELSIFFLISWWKHMLWVLIRSILPRRF